MDRNYLRNALDLLQAEVHENARDKGFYEGLEKPTNEQIAMRIALMHAELSEALESLRKREPYYTERDGKPEGFVPELADVVIRILDLCEWLDCSLAYAVQKKVTYNSTRVYKHGKAF